MEKLPVIYGWNKSSDAGLDNFAPSIFLGGCNFCCPYCMNSKLVFKCTSLKTVDINDIEEFVRENQCDIVNISGGEPTCNDELGNLIKYIKEWGCKVSMSTNGYNCEVIKDVISDLSYITMDFKTSWDKYRRIYNDNENIFLCRNIEKTLNILRQEKINREFDYEIRTTLYKPLVGIDEIQCMATYLMKNERWILQLFRNTDNMIDENAESITPYSQKEIKDMIDVAKRFCDNVSIRSV